jgi:hypothetical protein
VDKLAILLNPNLTEEDFPVGRATRLVPWNHAPGDAAASDSDENNTNDDDNANV